MNFIYNADSYWWSSRCRPGFDPRSVHMRVVVGEVALGQVFLRVLWSSRVSIIPPTLHNHLHLHVALTTETNRWSPGTFQKSKALSETEVHSKENNSHLVFIGLGSASVATISHVRASAIIFLPIAGNWQTCNGKAQTQSFVKIC